MLYLIQLGGIVMDGFWLFRSLSTGSARSGRNAGILSTIMTSVWGLLNIALSIASAWKEGFDDVLGLISGTFANVPVTCKFVRLLYYVPEINAAALKVLRVVDVVFDTAAFALDLASYIKKATATPAPAAA